MLHFTVEVPLNKSYTFCCTMYFYILLEVLLPIARKIFLLENKIEIIIT